MGRASACWYVGLRVQGRLDLRRECGAEARQRQIVEANPVEDLHRGADLALAAVDDHEVGQAPAQLFSAALLTQSRAMEPAPEHLLVAREVVRTLHRLHAEPPVFTLRGTA